MKALSAFSKIEICWREVFLCRVQPVSETPNTSLCPKLGINEIKSDEYDVGAFFETRCTDNNTW